MACPSLALGTYETFRSNFGAARPYFKGDPEKEVSETNSPYVNARMTVTFGAAAQKAAGLDVRAICGLMASNIPFSQPTSFIFNF